MSPGSASTPLRVVRSERHPLPSAIVISNDVANCVLNRVQVVPLPSDSGRLYPSEAMVYVNGVPHKAMADQIRTVSKERLREYVGAVSAEDLAGVELAIRRQLGLG